MNEFFDKWLMPAIGVLIILSLISFISGKLYDIFADAPKNGVTAVSSAANDDIFIKRAALLKDYEKNAAAFISYGYVAADGYSQDLAICKAVDSELVIFQFDDSTLGDFSVLRYAPQNASSEGYSLLSMTVYSPSMINVMLRVGDLDYKVSFSSADFSAYNKSDKAQYSAMMRIISRQDLQAMYDIFETDIENLSELCGVNVIEQK